MDVDNKHCWDRIVYELWRVLSIDVLFHLTKQIEASLVILVLLYLALYSDTNNRRPVLEGATAPTVILNIELKAGLDYQWVYKLAWNSKKKFKIMSFIVFMMNFFAMSIAILFN